MTDRGLEQIRPPMEPWEDDLAGPGTVFTSCAGARQRVRPRLRQDPADFIATHIADLLELTALRALNRLPNISHHFFRRAQSRSTMGYTEPARHSSPS